ncbi:MAG TPA: pyrroloquinoline quinone biosynthesis peptide chaperone PqqD [Pseudomonas sp.]|nr:pyrroloquinoline quinone biosynthesis peptide chaperone PqqD [Pseudomonas sp.]
MAVLPIDPTDRFEIRPPFMFRWESSQNAYLLLYPEGIVKLNKTGGDTLSLCDGNTSVAELIKTLVALYDAGAADVIHNGVMRFLEVSRDKGWIRTKA